jgi:hypothetical protein
MDEYGQLYRRLNKPVAPPSSMRSLPGKLDSDFLARLQVPVLNESTKASAYLSEEVLQQKWIASGLPVDLLPSGQEPSIKIDEITATTDVAAIPSASTLDSIQGESSLIANDADSSLALKKVQLEAIAKGEAASSALNAHLADALSNDPDTFRAVTHEEYTQVLKLNAHLGRSSQALVVFELMQQAGIQHQIEDYNQACRHHLSEF